MSEAGYNTFVSVRAKDGTVRDVAVCAGDSAETIGQFVIEAIHGSKLFQLSTQCDGCGSYMTRKAEQWLKAQLDAADRRGRDTR